jgi:transketolase
MYRQVPGSARSMDQNQLRELGQQLRVDAVRAAAAAGSGHPTSSMSAADLMAVLLAEHLRYDFSAPDRLGNDHLIFSKGHASPLLYAMYLAAGAIGEDELRTFRKLGSRLEGHPTPRLPWVDVATGSLGLGLPAGVGMAMAARRLEDPPSRAWVLCGDSELAEGSMWEAFEQAGHEKLANLTAIIDVNRLGQRGETRHGWDTAAYARRIAAFGWHTVEIDGHDAATVEHAYADAVNTTDRPTAVIARTMKGRGVAAVQDVEGAHGKPVPDADEAIAELGGVRDIRVPVHEPAPTSPRAGQPAPGGGQSPPRYERGTKMATRTAFGDALAAAGGSHPDLVVLDGEVADSTRTEAFAKQHPDRFFEFYIAEQQMLAAALGMQARGLVPVAATFAAFFTRAYDFVRMGAISQANLKLAGSHAGVSIGEDGPSQMGLEDLAMFRAVHGSVVLYPCDANQTAALVDELLAERGIGYLRTTRGNTPVIYEPGERFPIGGSKTLRSSRADQVTIIAAGVTVPEALRAADALAADGISARVIDLYSVKPVDTQTLRTAAALTGNFVTVEDHWPEGGLGDAVLAAFANGHQAPRITKLAVHTMPGSATPDEQLREAGIDAKAIEAAVRAIAGDGQALAS